MIGDDIEIAVCDIRGDKVRLGITAPKGISIHRKEIIDAIRRENRAASPDTPRCPACHKPFIDGETRIGTGDGTGTLYHPECASKLEVKAS